eukprot:g12558.t1
MTAQINDSFWYRETGYAIAGISEGRLFDPALLGLSPAGTSTACWRGYQAGFALSDERLVLDTLHVNLLSPEGKDEREVGPTINGVVPTESKGMFGWFNNCYEELNYHLEYNGGLLLADEFIRELYIHMGFHPAWKYKTVIELTFDNGVLQDAVDRSVPMEEFRRELLEAQGEDDPNRMPNREEIERFAKLTADKVAPAPQASDNELIRRTMLDLVGRIPSSSELRRYLASKDSAKRVKLVDELLKRGEYALHHRNELDDMLLAGKKNDREWRDYLLAAARKNRPWDRLFREMMVGREDKKEERPALTFLKVRAKSVDDMANDTSRLFFGVSINCAKCHDHPLVDDWKQDHFYGFSKFFSRTYVTKSDRLAEKTTGDVKFKTTAGKEKEARLMFLTGAVVEEPKETRTKDEIKKAEAEVRKQMKDKNAPPPKPPAFSPRKQLVELALRKSDNRFFAKSIVNRIWARFFGRGIIDPLDQMHSGNSASHPELLEWLANDLVKHKYDLKRLIRGIVLSQAYSRSSRWSGKGDAPAPEYFALATPRVLTPRQYALSLLFATAHPDELDKAMQKNEWPKKRESLGNAASGFAGQLERPTPNFQVSVDEALLFNNSKRVENDFLRDGRDKLVGYLKTIKDDRQLIEAAYLATLSRKPEAGELAAFQSYLKKRNDRRLDGIRQIVWALITSPEMRAIMGAPDPRKLKVEKDVRSPGIAFCVARVPKSQRLYVGTSDFHVHEIDFSADKPKTTPFPGDGHESYVTGLALAGDMLVSGSYDGRLIWWGVDEKMPVRRIEAHEKWIRRVVASPDGKLIASVADDMQCKLWDAKTGKLIRQFSDHKAMTPNHYPSMLYAAAFSADGKMLATGDKVGHVAIWETSSGKKLGTLEAPVMYTWDPRARRHSIGGIRSVAFSADAKTLAVGGIGKIGNIDHLGGPSRTEVFDWKAGKRKHELSDNKLKGLVEQIVFHPSGEWFVTVGGDHGGFVTFYETKSGKLIHQTKAQDHCHGVVFNETYDRLYTVHHSHIISWKLG